MRRKASSRREFLVRSGQLTAGALLPRAAICASASPQYHLDFTYREPLPIETLYEQIRPGLDEFVLEEQHDRIAAVLDQWSAGLRRSPPETAPVENVLSAGFRASSLLQFESNTFRSGQIVQAEKRNYSFGEILLGRDEFVRQFRAGLRGFVEILTADFFVTGLKEQPDGQLRTSVRYEIVGAGQNFHREQRVGHCELLWQMLPSSGNLLAEWRQLDEVRCRSSAPVYQDITAHALGGNASYSRQLVHGVDYWRTVLDGACGIDIYGHNGVSAGDIDGSGFDALYICQPAGLPNRLYRNRGDGTFEDITERAGVGVLENSACALFADFDNDGRQDLLVVRAGGPLLFLNRGDGRFEANPNAFEFANTPQGTFTGAAAADYDRDGNLDIYFCLYVYYQGTDQYKYPSPYFDANNGPPNFLMHNNGNGTFRDVTAPTGLNRNHTRYSFCCGWTDFDGNGWPDLYVVNDFGRKNLYRNNGDGTFADIAREAGVEDVGAGMSICSFDYDNDRAHDLYVADMWSAAGERITAQEPFHKDSPSSVRTWYRKHAMGNSLLHNNGSGVFEDRTAAANVGLGRWAWSSDAWDFDHDGHADLYIMNGMISGPLRVDLNSFFWRQVVAKSPDEPKPSHAYEQSWNAINELIRADYSWSGYERNVFYLNNGDGTFCDVSGAVGLDFIEDGRSFALADIDGDGRLEALLKNRSTPQLRVLKNVAGDLPPAISFRLRGTKSNRDAIGAVITIETSEGRQTRTLQAGSGFLSQHSKDVFFGLGSAKGTIRGSIRWPSGLVQSLDTLPANHRIVVTEGSSEHRTEPFRQTVRPAVTESPRLPETTPDRFETWLISPVTAPAFSLLDLTGKTISLSVFRGRYVLLYFWTAESEICRRDLAALEHVYRTWDAQGLALLTIHSGSSNRVPLGLTLPILPASGDTAAVYNILYRSLFDRHRDLPLPASLLLDDNAQIVKIYSGALEVEQVARDFRSTPKTARERLARALPFPSDASNFGFARNYLSLGSTYFGRGYFDHAGAAFVEALRDNPTSAEAHYGIGSVYLKQSKTAEARASFEKAVALAASYPDTRPNAWNNLGLISMDEQRPDEAIGFFKEALLLNPDHLVALENLGNALRGEQRWAEARQVLEHALTVAPASPEVNYSLGMVFAQLDDAGNAYRYLAAALKLRPVYPEAMNNLGVLYLRTRRRDDAVAEFEACIRAVPAFEQSYLNLARVHVVEGNREQARAILLALLKRVPKSVQAKQALEELK